MTSNKQRVKGVGFIVTAAKELHNHDDFFRFTISKRVDVSSSLLVFPWGPGGMARGRSRDLWGRGITSRVQLGELCRKHKSGIMG